MGETPLRMKVVIKSIFNGYGQHKYENYRIVLSVSVQNILRNIDAVLLQLSSACKRRTRISGGKSYIDNISFISKIGI
jgi:hypothetical protein